MRIVIASTNICPTAVTTRAGCQRLDPGGDHFPADAVAGNGGNSICLHPAPLTADYDPLLL